MIITIVDVHSFEERREVVDKLLNTGYEFNGSYGLSREYVKDELIVKVNLSDLP